MKHLFTFRQRPNESLTGKLARVSSDTLSQVSNKCRLTVGRLSTLFLLIALSFGFSSQAWAATSYFVNKDNWATPKAHIWGGDTSTQWPGNSMTNTNKTYKGYAIFSIEIGSSRNIIFSNNGSNQTSDQKNITAGKMYYNGSWINYEEDVPCDELVLRVYVSSGTPKLHAWDGNVSTGAWPGTAFTSMGSGWWSYTFSQKPTGNFLVNTDKDNNKSANMNFSNYSLCKCWSYTKDKSLSEKDCPQSCTTPTINWSTAPADGTVGGTMTASVTKNQSSATVTWQSSNTSVVTVNSAGVISYVGAGTATITAKYTGSGDYCAQEAKVTREIKVKTTVYLKLNDDWKTYGTKFIVWDGSNNVEMTKTSDCGDMIYSAEVSSYSGLYFKEYEGDSQKNEIGITLSSTNNMCQVTGWKSGTAVSYVPQYSVSFANGGHGTAPASVCAGGSYTLPAAITGVAGYTFNKWNDGVNSYNAGASVTISSAKTFTATWTANTNTHYTVKHQQQNLAGTGYDLIETENLTGTTGANVTPATKSYTGFTAPSTQTKAILADGSLVITYSYTRNKHKFAWDFASGSSSATAGTNYTAANNAMPYGSAITYPANNTMSRSGYNFTGWSSEATTMPDADLTITAQWAEASKCAVTYSKNTTADVTNLPSDDTQYLPNATVTVSSTTPSRSGYTFLGWNEAADGTGTAHAAGSTFTITSNVTLFAQWEVITYSISYTGLADASNTNPTSYTIETETITLAAPGARAGYVFSGWTCGGNPITEIAKGSTGDKTITANWTALALDVVASPASIIAGKTTVNLTTTLTGYASTYTLCYELWQNGAKMAEQPSFTITSETAASFLAPATAGDYTVKASVHAGADACDEAALITASTDITVNPNLETEWYIHYGVGSTWKDADFVRREVGNIAYATVTLEANKSVEFGYKRHGHDTWYGQDNEGGVIPAKTEWTLTGSKNVKMNTTVAGEYTFRIDFSGDRPKAYYENPSINAVTASWNSWTTVSNATVAGTTMTYEITFTEDQITDNMKFKVIYDGTYYGATSSGISMTPESHTGLGLTSDNSYDINFTPSVAGTYTFVYTTNTKKLSITYPETHKLTMAAGTGIASVGSVINYAIPGTEYELTATLQAGYENLTWTVTSGAGASVENKGGKWYGQVGTEDATFTASATPISYTLTMPQSGTGYTVEYTGGTSIPCDQTVTFTVTPATGYDVVVKMNGTPLSGSNNAYSFTMPAEDVTVTVEASLHNYEITMAVSPAGAGTTTPAVGTFTKHYNEVFDISAKANPGYRFVNWTSTSNINLGVGDPSGAYAPARKLANDVSLQTSKSQPNTKAQLVDVDGEKTITANFAEITYTVTVDGVNKQVGAITPVPINAAAAAADHQFKRWEFTGDVIIADVNQANTTIRATGTGTVTATYEVIPMYYTHGSNKLFADPDSKQEMSYDEDVHAYYIDIATDCNPYFYRFKTTDNKLYSADWQNSQDMTVKVVELNGTKVDADKDVTGWTNKSSIQVNLNAGSSIRVYFDFSAKQTWITGKDYITLTYGTAGDFVAGATLTFTADKTPTPDGDNTYPKGTTFTFTATPNSGDVVEGWFWNTDCPEDKRYTGGDLGVTEYKVNNAQQDVYMYVRFDQMKTINVQVAESDKDMGSVKPQHTITLGKYVIGTAKAESKDPTLYNFDYWEIPAYVTLHDSCTVNHAEIRVNSTTNDAMLTAHFKAREVTTVYFVNSSNWSDVKVHLWGGTAPGTTWPGTNPKKEDKQVNGHDVYSYTFDKGAYEHVQWNCGSQSCQTNNITIDEDKPIYNNIDQTLYRSFDEILPDPIENTEWQIMFGDKAVLLNYDNGHTWYAYLENVPVWTQKGNNWLKLQQKVNGTWAWRGIYSVDGHELKEQSDDDYKITSYPSTNIQAKSDGDGKQIDLAGHTEVSNLTITLNDETFILTVDYTKPMAVLTTSATEWDVDSKEPLVLRGYAKNATADCQYQFFYSTDGGTNWTNIGTASNDNVIEVTKEDLATVPNKLGAYKFKVTINTTFQDKSLNISATKDVNLYKYYWLAVVGHSSWTNHVYCWNSINSDKNADYPGLEYTAQEGDVKFYKFPCPKYNMFIFNNGNKEAKEGQSKDHTNDIEFNPNTLCYNIKEGSCANNECTWNHETTTCPPRIYRDFPANEYWLSLDGTLTLTPTIRYYGSDELTYTWTFIEGNDNVVLSSTNTPQTIVNPIKTGTTKVKFTVSDGNEDHVYDITIHIIDGITIRVYKQYDGWKPIIHTWNSTHPDGGNYEMSNEGNGWYSHTTSLNPVNFVIQKDYFVESYERTIDVTNVTESGCWIVSTKQEGTDGKGYHLIDKTEDCALYYRVHETLADGKTTYHSNKVKKSGDDLSFFAANDGTLTLQHYDESAGKFVDMKTLANPTASNVQVAKFTGLDVNEMDQYVGDFYIRASVAGDGDWSKYVDNDHIMTQFTRNANFPNEMYSYYWVQNVAKIEVDGEGKTYVGAAVANAINDDLAGIIPADAFTIQGGENDNKINNSTNGTNIRFGYEPTTNYFKRAMINGSSDDHFLDVYGDNSTYFNGGKVNSTLYKTEALADADIIYRDDAKSENHSLKFTDMSDWVYQAQVFARVDNTRSNDTKAIIASLYNDKWNYLLGYDEVNQCPTQAWTVLGNTSTKNITYAITIIYDFKTNRLLSAWTPSDMDIDKSMEVDADVMFLRHENEDVAQINVVNNDAVVENLNGVVFVLEVEDDKNAGGNQEKHYWITLPFDVNVSDIFGIEGFYDGQTGTTWGIQRYRGDLRAQKGWFLETPTFWEWQKRTDVLHKGEGYLVTIDKTMCNFKAIDDKSILRLYFPCKQSMKMSRAYTEEDLTVEYPNQPCTIKLANRYLQDGNWKMIGAVGYTNCEAKAAVDPEFEDEALTKFPNFRYHHNDGPTPSQQSYIPEPGYTREGQEPVIYRAFYSYPVQYAGTITWAPFTKDDNLNPELAPRRYAMENEVTNATLRLELQQNGKMMDQTFVQLCEGATNSFDQNLDLIKFGCGAAISEISTLDENDIAYGGNSVPVDTKVIPVAVNIKVAGTYTFAMPAGTEQMTVYLLDYETGDKIDLGLGNYTVTFSKKANIQDRFALMIDNRKLPTDTKVIDANGNELIKFIRNEQMYILRNGRLYNANGAELSK